MEDCLGREFFSNYGHDKKSSHEQIPYLITTNRCRTTARPTRSTT